MFSYLHCLQHSGRIRRTRRFNAPALLFTLLLVLLPATTATARASGSMATLTFGCSSPSDYVAKMTLAEKEGQMTQVEKNAFTKAGNSITDITALHHARYWWRSQSIDLNR